jgi:putative endonuclease
VPPFFVYILECGDGNRYYGLTSNLLRRIREHRRGAVWSTRSRLPVRLVWFHGYPTRQAARSFEKRLKGRHHRKSIDLLIAEFPKAALKAFE